MKEYGDTFLLAPFREFYREVIRLKHFAQTGVMAVPAAGTQSVAAEDLNTQAAGASAAVIDMIPGEVEERGAWGSPPGARRLPWAASKRRVGGAQPSAAPDTSLVVPSEIKRSTIIRRRLVSLLERQEAYASSYGGIYGAEFYKKAQYVMAALADEIFLDLEWEERGFWLSNLMESEIFGTHFAGQEFFRRLDLLLAERDPVYRGLGEVYLMALSLGFRGKYRVGDHGAILDRDRLKLESYRRQLFHFVFRREPGLDDEARHLFPEAYPDKRREETKRRLHSPRAWIILLCGVILAYITLTHGIWVKLTAQLFEVDTQIESHLEELGRKR
jgi:type VI secretion system protein ImpK